jgi:hypothetical protein
MKVNFTDPCKVNNVKSKVMLKEVIIESWRWFGTIFHNFLSAFVKSVTFEI